MSGEKTVQAEPLLEAKIVSVVSTSPLRGVEVQQDSAKSAPSANLADGALIKIMGLRNSRWRADSA